MTLDALKNENLPNSDETPDSHPEYMPPIHERKYNDYKYFLDINIDKLKGKKVLNVGSGFTGLFEKYAAEQGVDIYTLSPAFATPAGKKFMEINYEPSLVEKIKIILFKKKWPKIFPGTGENLPFEENTFDEILALYSVPLYSEEKEKSIQNIINITKPNGIIRLYPVSNKEKQIFEKLFTSLSTINSYNFTPITEQSDSCFPEEIPFRLTIEKK